MSEHSAESDGRMGRYDMALAFSRAALSLARMTAAVADNPAIWMPPRNRAAARLALPRVEASNRRLERLARLNPPGSTEGDSTDWEAERRAASGVDDPPVEETTLPSDLGAC